MNFLDLLKLVRGNILEGMANADVPFHKVTEALRVPRDSSRTSVFQAMFALQERAWHSIDDMNLGNEQHGQFKLKQFNHNTSKFEVHLQLRHDGNGGLEGDLHIATDLFTVDSGNRMVKMYKNLMQCCLNSPELLIGSHQIMPKSDQDIIVSSNNNSKYHDRISLIDQIFSSNTNYESVAFISDGPTKLLLTYRQFQEAVNTFSSYLLKKCCVKHQQRIGLLVKSCPQSLCALFGIIHVGCKFMYRIDFFSNACKFSNCKLFRYLLGVVVVLDPEKTPVDRCHLIFDDAGVNVVFIDADFESEFEAIRAQGHRDLINLDHAFEIENSINSSDSNLFQGDKKNPDAFETNRAYVKPNDEFGIFYTSGKNIVATFM